MSNANRIKVKLYWSREDSKTFVEIPVNKGKPERPIFILKRLMEIMFLKSWVSPFDIWAYIWKRDGAKIREDMERMEELTELKQIRNGG